MRLFVLLLILPFLFWSPALAADPCKDAHYRVCYAKVEHQMIYLVSVCDCDKLDGCYNVGYDNVDEAKKHQELRNKSAYEECKTDQIWVKFNKDMDKAVWREIKEKK